MVADATRALVEDVFDRKEIFGGLHQIRKRIVAWGPGKEPVTLPHSAVALSEEQLLERLRPATIQPPPGNPNWTIYASRPLAPSATEHHFGTRVATATPVRLRADPSACWIESLENGWLFLIASSNTTGWLLSVGNDSVESSRLIARQVEISGPSQTFPAYPRIAFPLCEAQWLACGTAALAFDPVCGDGTGNAIREAILATAVIQKAAGSFDVLEHYQTRLLAGFQRHLEQCAPFYATGHDTDWWRSELEHIREGIAWCQSQPRRPYRYQLRDFNLETL